MDKSSVDEESAGDDDDVGVGGGSGSGSGDCDGEDEDEDEDEDKNITEGDEKNSAPELTDSIVESEEEEAEVDGKRPRLCRSGPRLGLRLVGYPL